LLFQNQDGKNSLRQACNSVTAVEGREWEYHFETSCILRLISIFCLNVMKNDTKWTGGMACFAKEAQNSNPSSTQKKKKAPKQS
jgi:hypothetical protein